MELKKTQKVNLEKKRVLFYQIGFILVLLVVLIAFEWSSPKTDAIENQMYGVALEIDIEMLPPVREKNLTPPLPKPMMPEVLNIIDNETETESEIVFPDIEDFTNEPFIYRKEELEEEVIYFLPSETKPEFPGGEKALKKFIRNRLEYPVKASEQGIYGKVLVSFRINIVGEVENIKVINKVHPLLDNEAIRIVKLLPKWKPGKINRKAVASHYTIPVNFVLK